VHKDSPALRIAHFTGSRCYQSGADSLCCAALYCRTTCEYQESLHHLIPDELFAYIEVLEGETASKEESILGYKVNDQAMVAEQEAKGKNAVSQVILIAMAGMKGSSGCGHLGYPRITHAQEGSRRTTVSCSPRTYLNAVVAYGRFRNPWDTKMSRQP